MEYHGRCHVIDPQIPVPTIIFRIFHQFEDQCLFSGIIKVLGCKDAFNLADPYFNDILQLLCFFLHQVGFQGVNLLFSHFFYGG